MLRPVKSRQTCSCAQIYLQRDLPVVQVQLHPLPALPRTAQTMHEGTSSVCSPRQPEGILRDTGERLPTLHSRTLRPLRHVRPRRAALPHASHRGTRAPWQRRPAACARCACSRRRSQAHASVAVATRKHCRGSAALLPGPYSHCTGAPRRALHSVASQDHRATDSGARRGAPAPRFTPRCYMQAYMVGWSGRGPACALRPDRSPQAS